MNKRITFGTARFVVATVVLVALGTQLAYGLGNSDNFSIVNFFSFFTILSNFLAAVVFLVSSVALFTRINRQSLDYLRGAATLYMVITGIVYVVLLTNVDVQTPLPWVNSVIHYIFPLVILADWLLDPPVRAVSARLAFNWLVFPFAYVAYTLLRGPFAHNWYPYPFINVQELGYLHVLINCVLLTVVGALLAVTIAKLPVWLLRLKRSVTS